jgi:hypothetical protein
MGTFQLNWLEKTSGAFQCLISGTNRHLRRNTEVLYASWIVFSHERIQSPCQDKNQQDLEASGLKSTTLTNDVYISPLKYKEIYIEIN